ncbi:CD209 antigen-like protein E [Channa argus]|uniref:CD209 antigen-like protein E n=1 Tax=Channa argus TaxID=215402 RepID=UPI0035200FB1
MEEVYVNVEYDKSVHSRPSTDQTGPRRCHGPAVLCLGLLSVFLDSLASVSTVSLVFLNYNSVLVAAAELSTIKNNLTERLQDAKNKVSSLTEERNQLNASIIQMTEERKKLQSLSTQSKTCPAEWSMFKFSCYYISRVSASWKRGRQDCKDKEADLVVIDSAEEQKFLSVFITAGAWIGLTDSEEEGTWKWIDGSSLTLRAVGRYSMKFNESVNGWLGAFGQGGGTLGSLDGLELKLLINSAMVRGYSELQKLLKWGFQGISDGSEGLSVIIQHTEIQ